MDKPHPALSGWSISELARICRVNSKTASRWKAGQTVPPQTALMIISGDLGCFSGAWAGWRIRGEELIPPGAWPVRRDDALSVPLMHAQIQSLRAELEAARKALKALEAAQTRPAGEDQPTPDTWVIKLA